MGLVLQDALLPTEALSLTVVLVTIAYLLRPALAPGLRSLPGPFLAKFTNAWRLYKVFRGDFEKTTIKMHKQYGDVVRIGPNIVSIADPGAIESIYGLKANLPKVKLSIRRYHGHR
jgi:hypothetical protein